MWRQAKRRRSSWAEKIGGAVVLKVHSETITHKSDVNGVKLNLRGAAAVRRAYREIKRICSGGL